MGAGPSRAGNLRGGRTALNRNFAGSLTQQVIDSLGLRILRNELEEGSITTAASLQEEYGVSRTVVREACQVLQSKGMMQARTKTGTIILPRSEWNLLDPEMIGWYHEIGAGPKFVREMEEVRANYEPWAARIAAERRTGVELKDIRDAYEGMIAAVKAGGVLSPDLIKADLEFHQATLRATHNGILIRLGLLVRPVLQIRDEMAMRHDPDTDFLDQHLAVLDAIEKQQPDRAEEEMRGLLERAAMDDALAANESETPTRQVVASRSDTASYQESERTP